MGIILSQGRVTGSQRLLRRVRLTGLGVALCITVVALTSCSRVAASSADGSGSARLDVVAAFYPLAFVAQRVGGTRVRVRNLTPPGAEPHDLELNAKDLVMLRRADLVVYLPGLSSAVDDAVRVAAKSHAFDVTEPARLFEPRSNLHFWLDPIRLADVADAIAAQLAVADPASAADYRSNATTLRVALTQVDRAFTSGLANCPNRELVTSHSAFGYLANRYGLREVGIMGLAPDAEPTAAALAEIADFVKAHGVHTIYTETLVSAAVARTLGASTGAATMVLDPLEGLAGPSNSDSTSDYLSVMRENLRVLRLGQGCR